MKNNYWKILTGIFFIFCFVILYLGLKKDNKYSPNLINEKTFPSLLVEGFYSDKMISLDNILTDKNFYIINIWASWCLPCKEEHNFLLRLTKEASIKLIGINYKDDKNNAIKFLDDLKDPYYFIINDKYGKTSIQIGSYGVPETFVLNDKKKIIKKVIGPINEKSFKEILDILK